MTSELIPVADLSALTQKEFVDALSGIFEHSPWVAERAWYHRPFESRATLLKMLVNVMSSGSAEEQMALIRAHPELAGKAAVEGTLTRESTKEQDSAGLTKCTPDEFTTLNKLNDAYNAKFNHPFILAVKGLNRAEIISAFAHRLQNTTQQEFGEALRQIARIAEIRLNERIAP